ncbi:carbohydrate ABC transporter permease, partial [Agrobacterium sp. S2]|nr:carbohydrate ABC transporter permease [Agrobacterium sp. S2]
LYWMVAVSLTRPQDLIRSPPALFPTDPTFDGYALAIDRNLSSMGTSLLIALGTVVITLVIALPAAYGMSKLRAPGTGAVMFAFLLAQMIPSVVVVTALFALYKQLGLLDSYPGLMLANATASVPFAIILLQAFMRTIPDELLEAARIDGAGRCGRSGRSSSR